MINTSEMTPAIYSQESRDFQIYERLYDILFNMVKGDVDSITSIINTNSIKSEALPLLQTKLGFFTNYSISEDVMRNILCAFPTIIKNKGTILGIRQAVRVFLNTFNTSAEMDVYYTTSGAVSGNLIIPDHTVVVGVTEKVESFRILEEIFKYILPAGYSSVFYYYTKMSDTLGVPETQDVYRLTVGRDMSSSIRFHIAATSLPVFSTDQSYARSTLVRKPGDDQNYYRALKDVPVGACDPSVPESWAAYFEDGANAGLQQHDNGRFREDIKFGRLRQVLLNSSDTIIIYSSKNVTDEHYEVSKVEIATSTTS